ncbi:MAG: lipid II:glycine glycyltransferase FemX [Sphingomonadaceae bacterium]
MVSSPCLALEIITPEQACGILSAHGGGSWRQYPAYADCAARRIRARSHYLLVSDQGRPLALANVRVKCLAPLGGIALISHGPVLLRPKEHWRTDLPMVLAAIRRHICGQKVLVLRVDPDPAWARYDPFITGHGLTGFTTLTDKKYRTIFIDTTQDIKALRCGLAGKWRTDLNRAERGNLRISCSKNPADFTLFSRLLDDLMRRKGFSIPQNTDFFAEVSRSARNPEQVLLHAAWEGDEMISGHIGSFCGDSAVYLLGATTHRGRELRASHALHWAVILRARRMGLPAYDLGGIDEQKNPGVFRFKSRMGGVRHSGPAMIEARPHGLSGQIPIMLESVMKHLRQRAA